MSVFLRETKTKKITLKRDRDIYVKTKIKCCCCSQEQLLASKASVDVFSVGVV